MRQVAPLSNLPSRQGAERVRVLVEALGNPHLAQPVIHVGGTNGKGSVCALLAGVLKAAGKRVARFTSPHLESRTERFWVDGQAITPGVLESQMAEVRGVAARLEGTVPGPFTEFDIMTATAFVYFARQRVDVAIVEVGIGGGADATNVVDAPLLVVITNVSLDHADVLGADEEAIAREKAGIIKSGRPVLTQAAGRAYKIVNAIARERRASLYQVPGASFVSALPGGQRIGSRGRLWDLGLLGTFQLQNAALVLEAVERLRAEGWEIGDDAVKQGLAEASWPGRMELLSLKEGRWLLDGAHNGAGMAELLASLERHFPAEPIVAVLGVMSGKSIAGMRDVLARVARTLILTAPPSERALDPTTLGAGLGHPDLHVIADPRQALQKAAEIAKGNLVVVCGSLYLVGLARGWLKAK